MARKARMFIFTLGARSNGVVYSHANAQRLIDSSPASAGNCYELIPASVTEESVTTTKKVIV